MANSVVDIYNMALNAVGTRDDVSSPNEASREAEVCRRWFANARDLILRAAFWPSAEAHSRLSVLAERDETEAWTSADPSPGFRFAYAVPSDLLVPRYQADFGRFVFSTYGDSRAVMSNTEQVVLAYTRQQTNVSLWDHALLMAIVYSLGAHIAMPLHGKPARAKSMAEQANNLILSARELASNTGENQYDTVPDWIAARGYAGVAPSQRYLHPYGPMIALNELPSVS